MKRTAQLLTLALILCLSAGLSGEASAQTEALADPPIQDLYSTEYFPAVHQEFQNARESIVVTMYQIRVYPNSTSKSPTFTLVRDLINAHKRGVKVTVILNTPCRQHNIAEQMLTAGEITVRHVSAHRDLICLAEEAASSGKPWWTASGEALADKYPGNRDTIVRGLRELEKMNLLGIVRSTLPPGQPYSRRKPNSYIITLLRDWTKEETVP